MHLVSRLAMTCGTLSLCVSPASAATFATINLMVRIPVSCEIDAGNARLVGDRLLLSVRRTCNTFHAVVISGNVDGEAGDFIVHFDNDTVSLDGGTAILPQPERYFDGTDEVSIESRSGDQEELAGLMSTLQVSIDVD